MTTTLIVRCSLACVRHCTSDADHSLSAEPTFTCQFPRISYLHLSLTSISFCIKYCNVLPGSYYFLTYTLVSQTPYTPYSGVLKTELYYLQDLSLYFIRLINFVQIFEIELVNRAGFILLLS